MEIKEARQLNIVIMPKRTGSIMNVALSPKLVYVAAGLAMSVLFVNMILAMNYFRLRENLKETKKKAVHSSYFSDLQQETENLEKELEDIKRTNERIKEKTGISSEPVYSEYGRKETAMPTRAYDPELEDLRSRLSELRFEISQSRDSASETESKVESLMGKFSRIPSIKPIREAQLTSTFGYRPNPMTGEREFHMGMDLDGTTSTPIYATADGKVVYDGWRQGYGLTVEVNHGNGFTTIYAHNSRNLVSEGEHVVKGQIIGYVGSSGYTTGSHLHYEVWFKDKLLNPRRFMSLTIADVEFM